RSRRARASRRGRRRTGRRGWSGGRGTPPWPRGTPRVSWPARSTPAVPARPGEVDHEGDQEVGPHSGDRDAVRERALEDEHDEEQEDVAKVLHRVTASGALSAGTEAWEPAGGVRGAVPGAAIAEGPPAFGSPDAALSGAVASSEGIRGPGPAPAGM